MAGGAGSWTDGKTRIWRAGERKRGTRAEQVQDHMNAVGYRMERRWGYPFCFRDGPDHRPVQTGQGSYGVPPTPAGERLGHAIIRGMTGTITRFANIIDSVPGEQATRPSALPLTLTRGKSNNTRCCWTRRRLRMTLWHM